MIIVGLHSIHGIDSNTPEGAGAHPKEGGLRPTRHGGGGVGRGIHYITRFPTFIVAHQYC